jgi:multidrug efflux pump subunit AcrA (membrane-fusion protein)
MVRVIQPSFAVIELYLLIFKRCIYFSTLTWLFLTIIISSFSESLLASEYPAFLREKFRILLLAPHEGHITFSIKEGDYVKANQVLFIVNDPILPIQLKKARLALKHADANLTKLITQKQIEDKEASLKLQKQESLHRAGSLSDDAWEIAKIDIEVRKQIKPENIILGKIAVEQAKNEVDLVNQTIKDLLVVNPADGVISRIIIQNNEWTKPSQRLAEIIGVNPLIIYLNLPYEKVTIVKKMKKIPMTVQKGGKLFKVSGHIRSIAGEIDAITQTIQIQLELPNKNHLFLPGMKVNILLP